MMRTAAMIMAACAGLVAGNAAAQRAAPFDQRADDPYYRLDDRVYSDPDDRAHSGYPAAALFHAPPAPDALPPRPVRRDRWVSADGATVVTAGGGAHLRPRYDAAGGTTIVVESAPATTTTTTTTEIIRDEVTYRTPTRRYHRPPPAAPRSKRPCRCDS